MTVPAATFQTFTAIGNREDLSDVIYNISPTETPFMSNAQKMKASATYTEWQTDSLASAAANSAVQGDDATNATINPTVRLGNFTQILQKTFGVSGTQEAVDKAGRKSDLAYQIAKQGKELKRDQEYALVRNQGNTAGAASTAATLASVESWIFTNRTDVGTGGNPTTPGFISGRVAAPTDNSTNATMTKTHLDTIIQACWTAGGDPKIVMVSAAMKTRVAGFTGIATLYREVKGKDQGTIVGGADLYISNFGEHAIVPNRFMRTNVALVLDMEYWGVAYLRPFQQKELAVTGDAVRRQMLVECTLVSKNEAASGKITSAV
jgi:hypothetical protein